MDPSLGRRGREEGLRSIRRIAGTRDPPLNLRARGEVCICKFGDYIVVKIWGWKFEGDILGSCGCIWVIYRPGTCTINVYVMA